MRSHLWRYFLGRGEKGAPGAAFLNEGGKAKTGMKELLYKNSILLGGPVNNFILKNQWRMEYSIQWGKTDSELSRLSSVSLLCGETKEREEE